MGALGTLGVGLSVLFGIFLVVLAGEIYYMLCCRRAAGATTGSGGSSSRRRVSSVQVAEAAAGVDHMGPGFGFAREAALVGSFGGYAAGAGSPFQQSEESDFVSKFFPPSSLDDVYLPHTLLFPIAEETKEEMELQAGARTPKKLLEALPPLHPYPSSVTISVVEPSICASSSSVSFSVTPEATPFATPPSSPSASDTSSDKSLSSPASSLATAASRFSAHSRSPASLTSSPATAASRFSLYSQSPSPAAASPATANSRLSVNSPRSVSVSPAGLPLAAATPTSSSPGSHRSSLDAATSLSGDHGPLGALFRRQYYSPSRYSPLRPVVWPGHITDFRHALPFSPE